MPEIHLTGTIQKEPGRLYPESVRFLQIGCGIPFEPPTGRQRFNVVEKLPLIIATEKNGGLAETVAMGKYNWGIAGLDMVEGLIDGLHDQVIVVRKLGFQRCQYTVGVWESALEKSLLIEGKNRIEILEDLIPGIRIATKREHEYILKRIIRQRGLNLRTVHDPTPETAPELRGIEVVADIVRSGDTFREFHLSQREVLLESEAVLIRARKLPLGRERIFNDILLPRVDQALEHPERWLNPENSESRGSNGGFAHRIRENVDRLLSRSGKAAAVVSTLALLFTLLPSSVILNSWRSGISKEKELRS